MRRTSPVTAVCLVAAALFLLASGMSAAMASDPEGANLHTRTETDNETFRSVTTVHGLRSGDVLRLEMQRLQQHGPEPQDVRFFVVEGGQGDLVASGSTASDAGAAVIHAGSYPPWGFEVRRPSAGQSQIDLVFRYERPPGMTAATFDDQVNDLRAAVASIHVIVADGRLLALQPVWYAGAGAAMFVAMVQWVRPRHAQAPAEGQATPLEGLVLVQEMAHRYLLGMRHSLLLVGALLAVMGIAGIAAALAVLRSVPVEPRGWDLFLSVGSVVVVAAALALWGWHFRFINREVRRWRETPAPEV